MPALLSHALLRKLAEFVADKLGLVFPTERDADLDRGIQLATKELGFSDVETGARALLSEPASRRYLEALANHLTVGETYFFRDKAAFAAIEQHVLPELIRARREAGVRRLRLWSAACCSGEEAYSLAIAARRALPDFGDWQVTVLGTDITPRFLEKAERGVFNDWSFRDTPPHFRESFFTRTSDGQWSIRPEIRRLVQFAQLNLVNDAYPLHVRQSEASDLVLCRNTLIYFPAERAGQVVRNLADCLVEGGWLVLGPNEVSNVPRDDLLAVSFPGAILHRKKTPDAKSVVDVPESYAIANHDDTNAYSLAERRAEPSRDSTETPTREPAEPLPSVLLHQARASADQGRLDESLELCDCAVAADKLHPAAHYLRGCVLQELARWVDAAAAFKRALYLEPDFVLAHFHLGHIAQRQGQFADAARHFEHALALARRRPSEEILPESDGLTAGRLAALIAALRQPSAIG